MKRSTLTLILLAMGGTLSCHEKSEPARKGTAASASSKEKGNSKVPAAIADATKMGISSRHTPVNRILAYPDPLDAFSCRDVFHEVGTKRYFTLENGVEVDFQTKGYDPYTFTSHYRDTCPASVTLNTPANAKRAPQRAAGQVDYTPPDLQQVARRLQPGSPIYWMAPDGQRCDGSRIRPLGGRYNAELDKNDSWAWGSREAFLAQKLPEGGRFGLLDDPNSEWERAFIHLPAEGRRPGLLLLGSPRSSDGTGLTGSDRLLRIVALDDSSMRVLGRKFPEDEAEGMGSRRRFPRERAALASYDPAETERWFFSREACESGLSEVWDTIEQDGRMTTRAGFVVDEGAAYFRSVPGDDDGPPPIITGKTWYFWPNSVGELPTRHESPGPNYRSYFNKVYRQIIDTPEASEKLLKRVQAGWQPPHYSPGGPVPSAWPLSGNGGYGAPGFLRYVSEPFLPKKPPTYIAIPQEEGWLDIVRGRTRGGEYTVDVAFTKNVVAVRVSGIERESRKPNRIFREFRKLFFPYYMEDIRRTVILLRPQQINDADGSQREDLAYGCHDLREVRHSDFDHWADKFCWWLGPDEIGFISSRGEGLSTQNFPNISEKYNAHWFSPQAPTQSKVPSEDIQLHLK